MLEMQESGGGPTALHGLGDLLCSALVRCFAYRGLGGGEGAGGAGANRGPRRHGPS